MKSRKALVEHPFGTVKRGMGMGYLLCKGLEAVRAEMSLTVLAYPGAGAGSRKRIIC